MNWGILLNLHLSFLNCEIVMLLLMGHPLPRAVVQIWGHNPDEALGATPDTGHVLSLLLSLLVPQCDIVIMTIVIKDS